MSAEMAEPLGETPLQPEPLNGIILKVSSGCNIRCAYCYEYPDGEDTWSELQPAFMSEKVVEATAGRLTEYADAHNLDKMFVTFHGGEPLRIGSQRIDQYAEIFRNTLGPQEVQFGMQTNGMLLTRRIMEVLKKYDFRVGISLDGGRTANDRHRLDFAGKSTYDRVVRGIELLQEAELSWGLLAVIDLANNPLQTYSDLIALKPSRGIDFLLPLGNWDNPPPGRDSSDATPYADWLIPVWEKYIHSATTMPRSIEKFDALINLVQGKETLNETFGNPQPRHLFIRPNGGIYGLDTLTIMGADASELGMNVFEHSFEEAAKRQLELRQMLGQTSLAPACQSCAITSVCGGGYMPHRYSEKNGFNNPSVYCRDLLKLIMDIRESLQKYITLPKLTAPDGSSELQ